MTRRFAISLAAATLLALAAAGAQAQPVPGDETTSPKAAMADSAAAAADSAAAERGAIAPAGDAAEAEPPDTLAAPRRAHRDPLDSDRFEVGAASVKGPFDLLGTFGYERFLLEAGPFEHLLHAEVTYGKSGYLKEGTLAAGWLLRPLRSYKAARRIRPIVEVGPELHLVFQAADITGFSDTAFHTRAYIKTHGIIGVEALVTRRWGIVVRGGASVPNHRPLDYAQAAIFLR